MAKPPAKVRFDARSYPDSPEWFHRFLNDLNPFIVNTTRALDGKLSIVENLQAQLTTIEIATGESVENTFPIVFSVSGFTPKLFIVAGAKDTTNGQNPIFVAGVFPTWRLTTGGVEIRHLDGLSANSRYEITFLAMA